MSEVLSWREESWWERKSVPLGSHSLSPRQLALLASFGVLGDLLSMLIPPAVFGVAYLGKIVLFLGMLAIGTVIGSLRIRMIPIEFQLFFKATRKRPDHEKSDATLEGGP